ncbi:RecT family recombinase [Providencia hangzhouensis]|uniref:RecT family recombinase n=1 Tax=Providencia hangzhouensis TaxID=3031799 RepID=A0ABY9ZFZ4_9GAMM|nr:RecT family recombinase [Providencia hangzhouensis]WNK26113.1 RecT family recombinase [Providencia hangzhouensis]
MSEVALSNQPQTSVMNNMSLLFNPEAMNCVIRIADLMASGTATVPKHLQGKPADCLAIVMQASRWGMDPFAVGQKTHLINGTLGYEAQLVNSVITSSKVVDSRFHYEYGGDWEKIVGVKENRDESGLYIRVGAVLRGETEITYGEPVYLADVQTRNSPLWKTMPKQQIAYLAVKYWSRLYCPEVIMGVYTPDELEERTIKDVTPQKERVSLNEITQQNEPEQHQEATSGDSNVITGEIVDDGFNPDEMRQAISNAETLEQFKAIRSQIEELKSVMGTSLYTELTNKAKQAYHRVDSRNNLEAQINSLPAGGSPEAKAAFEKVVQFLTANKRKLGDELFDSFSLTLNDMKDEYQ